MKTLKELREKSVSQQQQKLMGLALAYKRGEVGDDEVSDEVKKIADTMSTKDLEDFAKTKHKGLPKKVDEYGGPPISRKDYLKQKPMQESSLKNWSTLKNQLDEKVSRRENVEDEMPASPDEKRMAMKQAEFIQYVGREIGEHLAANKEFPEWMQNKLSALHQKAKDMHSTLGAHGGEEGELDEKVQPNIKKIADFTGTRAKAVEDFISKHALDVTKLLKYVQDGGLSQRREIVSAIAGKPNNPVQKKIIKMFSESVELDESATAKIYDAAMFLKRLLGFESNYERRLRQKRAGAKNLKKSDIEAFIKDAEPFLNFIKDGKARYYKSMLNKLKKMAGYFDRFEGDEKKVRAMDAVEKMIQIRNYISRNKPSVNKESVELDEVTSYTDPSYKGWDKKLTSYGLKKGYTPVAVIGKGSKDMVLFDLKSSDKSAVRGVKLSSGEKIYRYASDGTVSGDMMPYVKVNLDKGTVYFLDQESSSGETDEVKFDRKGEKQGFVRVVESVGLDENFRTLARHGMGTEPKDSRTKVGLGIDYYDKDGNKRSGKIIKTDAKGYTVKDDRDGKTHSFSFHDRTKAKELLSKHGKGQYKESMTFDKIRNR